MFFNIVRLQCTAAVSAGNKTKLVHISGAWPFIGDTVSGDVYYTLLHTEKYKIR